MNWYSSSFDLDLEIVKKQGQHMNFKSMVWLLFFPHRVPSGECVCERSGHEGTALLVRAANSRKDYFLTSF